MKIDDEKLENIEKMLEAHCDRVDDELTKQFMKGLVVANFDAVFDTMNFLARKIESLAEEANAYQPEYKDIVGLEQAFAIVNRQLENLYENVMPVMRDE